MHVVNCFAGQLSEGITHLQRWDSRSASILDSNQSNGRRFPNLRGSRTRPRSSRQCPESSLVEHVEES
eukprot:445129-Rhodomonas_salina.1